MNCADIIEKFAPFPAANTLPQHPKPRWSDYSGTKNKRSN
jgi:hypothetical protein